MQGLAETSQVYEAQKLRELESFLSAWMSFGLNTGNQIYPNILDQWKSYRAVDNTFHSTEGDE